MDASKELLNNSAILRNIFKNLNLEEQIRCVDICETFRCVIAQTMWEESYHNLNIYKTPYVTIITNSGIEQNEDDNSEAQLEKICEYKAALKCSQCNVFLVQMAPRVRNLRVFSEYISIQQNLGVVFHNIEVFKNLRHLSYHRMVVCEEQLQLMARHCLFLERLKFVECTCGELLTLIPGHNLEIGNLAKMSQLRQLVFQCEMVTPQPEIDSEVLHDILTQLTLKSLILQNFKIKDYGADTVRIANGDCVDILNVGIISLEFWPNFKHHLKDFSNLTELTINVLNCNTFVNSSILELVAVSCRHLLKLSLENCDLYVEEFDVIKSLKHLKLLSCGGFMAINLQQVLGSLALRTLSLVNTRILDTIADMRVQIATSLEEITIDTIYYNTLSEIFQNSLNNMDSLHTIKWLNGDINDTWILDKCPNLRVLHIPNPYLIRRCIFKMNSLQELSFTSCKGASWSFFLLIIRNLRLKRLQLQTSDCIHDSKEVPQSAYGVRTSLRRILMPFRMFKMAQNFWMDLLSLNWHLKLVVYGGYRDLISTTFLRSLLEFPLVRNELKYLRICGFSIGIDDLQNSMDNTLQKLNAKISHYRSRNLKITMEL